VKPADTSGHDPVRFDPDIEKAAVGLFVLNYWLGPKASISAERLE